MGGRKRERSPRISDVAQEAGVSTATVSRALSAPDQVREVLRERVNAAVIKLGYTPNAAARSLRARRSRTVLVLTLKRWSAPFFADVLRGLEAAFSEGGYAMVLGNLDMGGAHNRHIVDLMFSGHIDGAVVLSGVIARDGERSMLDSGLPLVSLCAEVEGTHAVLTEEAECLVEGTRRLMALGHRDFLYVSGPAGNYNEVVRREAVERFFAEPEQAHMRLRRVDGGDFSTAAGIVAAQRFLAMDARPTAVLAAADEIAIGFMKTVRGVGVRVPEEVSILGFDGIEFADFCEPTLSTIRQPRYEIGRLGAEILITAIEAKTPIARTRRVLPNVIDLRQSTGPAPHRKP